MLAAYRQLLLPIQPCSSLVTISATIGCIVLALLCRYLWFGKNSSSRRMLEIVLDPATYAQSAKAAILKQLQTSSDKPFRVISGNDEKIVLPSKFLDETKASKHLCLRRYCEIKGLTNYPGFEAVQKISSDEIVMKATRRELPKVLPSLTPTFITATTTAVIPLFPPATADWTPAPIAAHATAIVTRVLSTSFCGPHLATSPDWLSLTSSFARRITHLAIWLYRYPTWLRPVVCRFSPALSAVRSDQATARRLLESRPAGAPSASDWFDAAAEAGRPFDHELGMLALTMAATPTSAGVLCDAMLDLAAHPDVMKEVLREVRREKEKGEGWLERLRLLDSALKETQRLRPTSYVVVKRAVIHPTVLSDGTELHKGDLVCFPATDPAVFGESADAYDAYRFLRLRETQGEAAGWRFEDVNAAHAAFGYGRFTCPGRHFAANMLKVVVAHLLENYEWKLVEDGVRPQSVQFADEVMPNPEAKILFRARKPMAG